MFSRITLNYSWIGQKRLYAYQMFADGRRCNCR